MTRKLEELLNLPEHRILIEPDRPTPAKSYRPISDFDKIDTSLTRVTGLGKAADTEFDELAAKAMAAYEDLMDLGMNVEARYSARLFEVANGMLKSAITAKSAKVDKKLRMIDLQIKKHKLDQDLIKQSTIVTANDNAINIQGDGFVVEDRNSLLAKLKNVK